MFRWLGSWVARHRATPQKFAERSLYELRLELFHAEQRLVDAQSQADYYRARLRFLEDVVASGIEIVSDRRQAEQQLSHSVRFDMDTRVPHPNSAHTASLGS